MTILNLSAVDYGGAGNFSVDFHRLLKQFGHDSHLLVLDKKSTDPQVVQYPNQPLGNLLPKVGRRIAKARYPQSEFAHDYYFYGAHDRFTMVSARRILAALPATPDVIFIHWATDFINARVIGELYRLTRAKIYWLMIDNAPITGGCHYPWTCVGYQTDCRNCPAILNPANDWIAAENLRLKKAYLPRKLGVVAFSASDYERARRSAVFQDRTVARMTGYVDETRFVPGDPDQARQSLDLPTDHVVLFFGATFLTEKRKGMQLLLDALEQVNFEKLTLLIAGNLSVPIAGKHVRLVGHLSEDGLIRAYQAADLFVCPSVEDSGPMMVNQSLVCGTPVVAFDTGVAQDLVITGETGYRAALGDVADLARGIRTLIEQTALEKARMATTCRETAIFRYGRQAFRQQLTALLNNESQLVEPQLR